MHVVSSTHKLGLNEVNWVLGKEELSNESGPMV